MSSKKPVSISLPETLIDRIEREARKQGRTRSGMIRRALKEWLENEDDTHNRPTDN